MRHSFVLLFALSLFGDRLPAQRPDSTPRLLLPGDSTLKVEHFKASTAHLRVLFRRPADSTEREYSTLTRQDAVADGRLVQSFDYPPPRSVKDSLVVKRNGLVPENETLSLGKVEVSLRYLGPKVIATVKQNDSTRTFDRSFSHDVFAFNQLEAIIRSLDYHAGVSVVVPLFSEQDLKLEYDTLSVIGSEATSDNRRAWRVRFADPVIVSEYVVDAESRRILSQLTTQRASQARFRYEIRESGEDPLRMPPPSQAASSPPISTASAEM